MNNILSENKAYRSEPRQENASAGDRVATSSLAYVAGVFLRTFQKAVLLGAMGRVWGQGALADWLVLVAATGYVSAADLGLGAYVCNLLSFHHAKGAHSEYRRVYSQGSLLTLVIGLSLSAVWIALAIALPLKGTLGIESLSPAETAGVFSLLGLAAIVTTVGNYYSRVYRSFLETTRSQLIIDGGYVIQIILMAGVLVFGLGPAVMATLQLVSALLLLGVFVVDLPKRNPLTELAFVRASVSSYVGLLAPSLVLFGVQSANSLAQAGITTFSANRFGAAGLLPFSLTTTVVLLISSVAQSISQGVWQELSHLSGKADRSGLQSATERAFRHSVGVTFLGAMLLVVRMRDILIVWVGKDLPALSPGLVWLQAGYLVSLGFRLVPFVLLMATNRLHILLRYSILYLVVALAVVLVAPPGMTEAPALALFLANALAFGPLIWPAFQSIGGCGVKEIGLATIRATLAALVLLGVNAVISILPGSEGVPVVLSLGLVCAAVGIIWLLVVCDRSDHQSLLRLVRRFAPMPLGK